MGREEGPLDQLRPLPPPRKGSTGQCSGSENRFRAGTRTPKIRLNVSCYAENTSERKWEAPQTNTPFGVLSGDLLQGTLLPRA